jgi:hypothetical protein
MNDALQVQLAAMSDAVLFDFQGGLLLVPVPFRLLLLLLQ